METLLWQVQYIGTGDDRLNGNRDESSKSQDSR